MCDSALLSGAPSRSGSEPDGHFYAGIAQLVEQLICNQQVVSSSPSAGSIVNRDSVSHPKSRLDTSWTLFGSSFRVH